MQMNHKSYHITAHGFGWRVYASFFLLMYPLFRAILNYVHDKIAIDPSDVILPSIAFLLLDRNSEFDVLAVLFGLCFSTLIIGLRMVLRPAAIQRR